MYIKQNGLIEKVTPYVKKNGDIYEVSSVFNKENGEIKIIGSVEPSFPKAIILEDYFYNGTEHHPNQYAYEFWLTNLGDGEEPLIFDIYIDVLYDFGMIWENVYYKFDAKASDFDWQSEDGKGFYVNFPMFMENARGIRIDITVRNSTNQIHAYEEEHFGSVG